MLVVVASGDDKRTMQEGAGDGSSVSHSLSPSGDDMSASNEVCWMPVVLHQDDYPLLVQYAAWLQLRRRQSDETQCYYLEGDRDWSIACEYYCDWQAPVTSGVPISVFEAFKEHNALQYIDLPYLNHNYSNHDHHYNHYNHHNHDHYYHEDIGDLSHHDHIYSRYHYVHHNHHNHHHDDHHGDHKDHHNHYIHGNHDDNMTSATTSTTFASTSTTSATTSTTTTTGDVASWIPPFEELGQALQYIEKMGDLSAKMSRRSGKARRKQEILMNKVANDSVIIVGDYLTPCLTCLSQKRKFEQVDFERALVELAVTCARMGLKHQLVSLQGLKRLASPIMEPLEANAMSASDKGAGCVSPCGDGGNQGRTSLSHYVMNFKVVSVSRLLVMSIQNVLNSKKVLFAVSIRFACMLP